MRTVFITSFPESMDLTMRDQDGVVLGKLGRHAAWEQSAHRVRAQVIAISDDLELLRKQYNVPLEWCLTIEAPR